jgi:hypothetical protein
MMTLSDDLSLCDCDDDVVMSDDVSLCDCDEDDDGVQSVCGCVFLFCASAHPHPPPVSARVCAHHVTVAQNRKDVVQIFGNLIRRQIGTRSPTVEYLSTHEQFLFELVTRYSPVSSALRNLVVTTAHCPATKTPTWRCTAA